MTEAANAFASADEGTEAPEVSQTGLSQDVGHINSEHTGLLGPDALPGPPPRSTSQRSARPATRPPTSLSAPATSPSRSAGRRRPARIERAEITAAARVAADLAALGIALAGEAAHVGRTGLAELVEAFERNVIVQALARHSALSAVAHELRVSPRELEEKIVRHGLTHLLSEQLWPERRVRKPGRMVKRTANPGEEPRRRGRPRKTP